jgi:hypothetical protein
MHLSSQAPGRRPGTHADDIDPADFLELLDATAGLADFDVMFECKRKDLAVPEVIRAAEAAGRLEGAGDNTRGVWLRSPAGVG